MVCAVFSCQFCWISGALVISGVQHDTAAALSIHSLSERFHVSRWNHHFFPPKSLKMEALLHNTSLKAVLLTKGPSWWSPSPSLVCSKVDLAIYLRFQLSCMAQVDLMHVPFSAGLWEMPPLGVAFPLPPPPWPAIVCTGSLGEVIWTPFLLKKTACIFPAPSHIISNIILLRGLGRISFSEVQKYK